jgi:hypothetical protein
VWKIQQATASIRKNQLGGKVQVDEFLVGGYEEGKVGRSGFQKRNKLPDNGFQKRNKDCDL